MKQCIIQYPTPIEFKCDIKPSRCAKLVKIQYPTPIELKCDIKLSERAILVNTSAVIYKMMYVWGAYKDVHQVWRGIPICNLPAIAGVHGIALKNNVITKTKKKGKTFYLVDREKLRSFRSKFLTSISNTDLVQIQETAKMFDLIPGITRFPSYLHSTRSQHA